MTPHRYLNSVLTVIAVMLGLNFWIGIHQSPASASIDPANTAVAQGPASPGKQRQAIVDQLKTLNGKIDSLSKKLGDGSITVTVQNLPAGD